ncbi:class II myosin, partial [Spiromyces aspiralis]
ALTTRTIETPRAGRRGSVYEIPLNPTQATAVRNALAQSIYNRLFDWIVARVNRSLNSHSHSAHTIGVLDIYGFEIFESNSFEQLCINYVNEKLQQIFIELTLKAEQEEYVRERIEWTPIKYFNNKIVCDLIEAKRPPGIFAAMNDACATAHADSTAADNSFRQRLTACTSNPHLELYDQNFTVKHYAGNVTYTIDGMTDKNKDQLQKDLLELCKASGNRFLQDLFPEPLNTDARKRPPTASDRIKLSANELFTKLMQSQPSYIRTIKPNENKSPTEYDDQRVLHQIKYLGLCENIRVRRAGFAYRQTFDKVVERFYLLSSATSYAGDYVWKGDAKSACTQIFKDTGIDSSEWQLGVTKAFIRHPETLWALENQREMYWHNMATRIQRAWSKFMAHKHDCATKIQQAWSLSRDRLRHVKEREEARSILSGRKQRRRHSMASTRTFYGDYLGVLGSGGQFIRETIGITENDAVLFSSRGETLVARKMRSAKPGPRILVLTPRDLFVVAQGLDQNGVLTHTLEHRVALASISQVSMSPLQDGWMVFHVNSQPDLVARCDLKAELMYRAVKASGNRIAVNISATIKYNNKNMKATALKFEEAGASPHEQFEKKVVRVCSGLPSSSESRQVKKVVPTTTMTSAYRAPRKAAQPATRRPNTNVVVPGMSVPTPASVATTITAGGSATPKKKGVTSANTVVTTAALEATQQQQELQPAQTQTYSAANSVSSSSTQVPPPPPPPPPAAPAATKYPRYKALYDFPASDSNMELVANMVYEIIEKSDSGWWLARKEGETDEGWVPYNYLNSDPEPPKQAVTTNDKPSNNHLNIAAAMKTASQGLNDRTSNSMAELAAALANRPASPNGGIAAAAAARSNFASRRPAYNSRPIMNDDSDEEWV